MTSKKKDEEKEIKTDVEMQEAEEGKLETEEETKETKLEKEEKSEEVAEPKSEEGVDEELVALKDAQIAKLNDQLLRNMAEFNNFRNRSEKEKSMMFEKGATGIIEKLLPIIDNFERALEVETKIDDGYKKGVELIYKQLLDTLDQLDVKEIDALHKPFDPDLHHAIAHEENDEYDENTVIQVMQKGYTYRDKVIRYAMVSVAN